MVSKRHVAEGVRIAGAWENNLRDLTLTLPEHQVVALAGASGAGKSTLAHQILAATARHRLGRLRGEASALAPCYQPKVSKVENLPPCIEFPQEPLRGQSRSTVATYSGVLDLLASLFLGFGDRYSLGKAKIQPLNQANLAEWVFRHFSGKTMALAKVRSDIKVSSVSQLPVRRFLWKSTEGEWIWTSRAAVKSLLPASGSIAEPGQPFPVQARVTLEALLHPAKDHLIWLVDGLVLDAAAHAVAEDDPVPYNVSSRRLFSFNSSLPGSGRCPHCAGLGVVQSVDENRLIRASRKPLVEGGLNLAQNAFGRFTHFGVLDDSLRGLFAMHGLPPDLSWERCPVPLQRIVMYGSGSDPIPELPRGETKPRPAKRPFAGIVPLILAKAHSPGSAVKVFQAWLSETKCPECNGSRFNRSARAFEWRGYHLADLTSQHSIGELAAILRAQIGSTRHREAELVGSLGIILGSFQQLNLGHLSLMRSTASLSGGEAQRLKLGLGLSLELTEACYILDEPSRGLHPQDVTGLAAIFRSIAGNRNSLVLVDHQPLLLQQADHVVILGPGGGQEGGRIVYQGQPLEPNLSKPGDEIPPDKPRDMPRNFFEIKDLSLHNLRGVKYRVPVARLTAVTGVSGAGKSTAILLGLVPAVQAALDGAEIPNGSLHLPSGIGFVEVVGQKLAKGNRRSVVATVLELFDPLRNHFAALPESKALGLKAGDFSFNSTGACIGCGGTGVAQDGFGDEINLRCHLCGGARLSNIALLPRSGESSIIDLLRTPLATLAENPHPAFDSSSTIVFSILIDLGLGYLSLDRSTSTLSAGERQRLALARFLAKLDVRCGAGLLVLDEPTAGLSSSAARRVFEKIRELTESEGHTALVLEHKLDLLPLADWILEFGPGGGPEGGRVIFEGPPAIFANVATPTATAWQKHYRPPTLRQAPDTTAIDGHNRVEITWRACAEAFESLATKGEIHVDAEFTRTIRPAVCLDPRRIPADTRVGELLDLLPRLRELAQPVLPSQAQSCADEGALATELQELSFGFSPVAPQWRLGVATPSDLSQAIRTLQKLGFREGFAGGRSLPIAKLKHEVYSIEDLSTLFVVCPSDAPCSMREIALRWGQGVVHLLGKASRKILTTRFLSRTLIGLELHAVQAGDFRSPVGRCSQCIGSGCLPTYGWELIVADPGRSLADDRFWVTAVLDGIRSLRRSRLLPESEFFAQQLIADFRQPPNRMTPETRFLFEHGIPWRNFRKTSSSRSDRKQDYYSWRGLHDYIYLNLGRIKDVTHKQRLKDSFKELPCPVCNGTGMGWEAAHLEIHGMSLIDVWRNLPLIDWQAKTRCDAPALQSALTLKLGNVRADDRFCTLKPEEQEKLIIAACAAAPLKNLAVISSHDEPRTRKEVARHGMKLTSLDLKVRD